MHTEHTVKQYFHQTFFSMMDSKSVDSEATWSQPGHAHLGTLWCFCLQKIKDCSRADLQANSTGGIKGGLKTYITPHPRKGSQSHLAKIKHNMGINREVALGAGSESRTHQSCSMPPDLQQWQPWARAEQLLFVSTTKPPPTSVHVPNAPRETLRNAGRTRRSWLLSFLRAALPSTQTERKQQKGKGENDCRAWNHVSL